MMMLILILILILLLVILILILTDVADGTGRRGASLPASLLLLYLLTAGSGCWLLVGGSSCGKCLWLVFLVVVAGRSCS